MVTVVVIGLDPGSGQICIRRRKLTQIESNPARSCSPSNSHVGSDAWSRGLRCTARKRKAQCDYIPWDFFACRCEHLQRSAQPCFACRCEHVQRSAKHAETCPVFSTQSLNRIASTAIVRRSIECTPKRVSYKDLKMLNTVCCGVQMRCVLKPWRSTDSERIT